MTLIIPRTSGVTTHSVCYVTITCVLIESETDLRARRTNAGAGVSQCRCTTPACCRCLSLCNNLQMFTSSLEKEIFYTTMILLSRHNTTSDSKKSKNENSLSCITLHCTETLPLSRSVCYCLDSLKCT